jgi:CRISPR-associated protein Csd2
METAINNRYEFVMLYDVENGNPNGDPDAGNLPRIDPETGFGIVTDVCLKRKIRNYVELKMEDKPGYKIYVKEGIPLNRQHSLAYKDPEISNIASEKDKIAQARAWMCANFFDIRTFGAVMTTGVNCGQVRGPVQINFSRSQDPIVQQEVTITRVTVTREDADKTTEMGRKFIVPYGLYRVEGYISPKLANDAAKGTRFSQQDLDLLWEALLNMFEHDHSASRGKMTARKLIVFKHASELGNAPSQRLFDLVKVTNLAPEKAPRAFSDYRVELDRQALPDGVDLIEMR